MSISSSPSPPPAGDTLSEEITAQRSFDAQRPLNLHVSLLAGRLAVVAGTDASALVTIGPVEPGDTEAAAVARSAKIELREDRLDVSFPQLRPGHFGRRRHPALLVRVALPLGSSLEARLGAVDVTCDGALSAVNVANGSGRVDVDTVTGELSLRTGSGQLDVVEAGGRVHVRAGSAHIRVGHAAGGLSVRSGAGEVDVSRVSGDVTVVSGAATVRIAALGAGRTEIKTGTGDVTLGIVAGTEVSLDVDSQLGQIRTDLTPLEESSTTSGPGILTLRVRSGTGRVHVHRADAIS